MKYFPSDIYQTVLLSSIFEAVGYVCSGIVVNRLGLFHSLRIFYCISAVFAGLCILASYGYMDLLLVSTFLAKFGISAVYSVVYLLIPEFFSPAYRSSIFGIANFTCRTLTSMSSLVAEVPAPIPMLSFFLCTFLDFWPYSSSKRRSKALN
mmetsp:Transcript_40368/g.29745  ORF Transcript_40368/g.29745 Transcript_40368/m.29745 type:complete len:151 (-) Transcript_40368:73-525(-)